MRIGINLRYNKLDLLLSEYNGYRLDHIQIGLPADVVSVSCEVSNKIKELRRMRPDIDISFHAYPYNLAECVPQVQKAWAKMATQVIHLANQTGALFVNFHAGYAFDATRRLRHNAMMKEVVIALETLVATGAQNNVEIHIENVYSEHRNSDFTKFGDRLTDFSMLFEQIESSFLKLCYDYGHGNLDEHGIDILRNNVNRLGSVHAHDNDQASDIHWPIGSTNLGTIEWNNEIQFLKENRFQGAFILENDPNDQLLSLQFLSKQHSLIS